MKEEIESISHPTNRLIATKPLEDMKKKPELISPEEKEKLLKAQHEYYSKTYILFLLLQELKNREFAILSSHMEKKHIAVRLLYSTNINYLQMNLKAFGVSSGKKLCNLYRGSSIFKPNTIPVSTYFLEKRLDEEKYQKFFKSYEENAISIDFIVDIDGETTEEAYKIAKELYDLFMSLKICFYIKNSGRRGFHLCVPYAFSPDIPITELIELYKKVLKNLAEAYGFEKFIDTSTAKKQGLIKLSYSLDCGSGVPNVVLPLTSEMFENWKPEMCLMDNVLKNVKLLPNGKARDLCLFRHNLSDEQLKENFKKFLKDFS